MDRLSLHRGALYFLLLGNVFLVTARWWGNSGGLFGSSGGSAIALGRLAGLFGELAIILMILLMSRVKAIESAFGHDRMNRLHRIIGYSVALFLLGHPLLLVWGYSISNGTGLTAQFLDFLRHWDDILKAVLGLGLLIAVIFFSLPWIRRKLKYENWHTLHFLVYPAFILFFDHQTNAGDMAAGAWRVYWYVLNLGAVGAFLAYRWGRPLFFFVKHRFRVARIEPEAPGTYSVYLKGRELDAFRFQPGQFANFIFFARGLWSPHPFSFSAATSSDGLRFTVKASGDFTSRIQNIPLNTPVLIDGPLGRFTKRAARKDKYLFLAGGIGITPIRALVEELAAENADAVLLYAARSEEDLAFRGEIRGLVPKTHFVLSREKREPYGEGRLDEEKIRRLAPDFAEREIYICGPEEMINSMRGIMEKLGLPKNQIHYERFAL